jgi:CRP-like cAMP-binding protein
MNTTTQPGCNECDRRSGGPLCVAPGDASRRLDGIKEQWFLARGAMLFEEGEPCRGVYLLCEGSTQLSISSENGRRLILRTAAQGEMLALGACLSGQVYQYTAELLEPAQVVFIERQELLKFLRENPSICLEVVRHLSDDLHQAYERVRAMGLSRARGVRAQRASSLAC